MLNSAVRTKSRIGRMPPSSHSTSFRPRRSPAMIRMRSPCRSGTASAKIDGPATAWEENKRGGGADQLMPDRKAFSHILFDLDHTLTYYPVSSAGVIVESFGR